MGNNVYGIDLGTCNIKIYSKNDDGIMACANCFIEGSDSESCTPATPAVPETDPGVVEI